MSTSLMGSFNRSVLSISIGQLKVVGARETGGEGTNQLCGWENIAFKVSHSNSYIYRLKKITYRAKKKSLYVV